MSATEIGIRIIILLIGIMVGRFIESSGGQQHEHD